MQDRTKLRSFITSAASLALGLALVGCSTGGGGGDGGDGQTTITVWDYYGAASPITAAAEEFEAQNPDIKVNVESLDWGSMLDKFPVAVSSSAAPDLATLDMTWLPTFASAGLLHDVSQISGGTINDATFDEVYSEGALDAMTYDDTYVTALYDFDAYALFYRADILEEKGLEVPTTWDEWLEVAEAMSEDSDGDGAKDKYTVQIHPDTFHYAQFLYQNGGSFLTEDGSAAAFNDSNGVGALEYMEELLSAGGTYWGPSKGDDSGMTGIKDDSLAMFVNGPYMMGVLKDGAPEQSGEWGIAPTPVGEQQASYLGGTGLAIPTGAENSEAAWEFAQFLLTPENQESLFTIAGAAPATLEGLQMPALTAKDEFFINDEPFAHFQEAMETAQPFPYIAKWDFVADRVGEALEATLTGTSSAADALDKADASTDGELGG